MYAFRLDLDLATREQISWNHFTGSGRDRVVLNRLLAYNTTTTDPDEQLVTLAVVESKTHNTPWVHPKVLDLVVLLKT
jgi:hypothetical protein